MMNCILTICKIFPIICILLSGCEKEDVQISFKGGREELLSFNEERKKRLVEYEDFKNFSPAHNIFVDLDLSREEVWDIAFPRNRIKVYPDDKLIRELFTHTYQPIRIFNNFESEKIYLSIKKKKEENNRFFAQVNPVLRKNGLPPIRKEDISFYFRGTYRVNNDDSFWYRIDGVTLKNGVSFILFTKIPIEVAIGMKKNKKS